MLKALSGLREIRMADDLRKRKHLPSGPPGCDWQVDFTDQACASAGSKLFPAPGQGAQTFYLSEGPLAGQPTTPKFWADSESITVARTPAKAWLGPIVRCRLQGQERRMERVPPARLHVTRAPYASWRTRRSGSGDKAEVVQVSSAAM